MTRHPTELGTAKEIQMTDTAQTSELDQVGHRVVLAAGRHWTRCDQISLTEGGVRLDLDYRGTPYTVTADAAGTVTGLPEDMPLFRRVAVETHLQRLVGD